jgi:hypothetical protein
MTLVLGACAADEIVLGAESKTSVVVVSGETVVSTSSQLDRKLFKLDRVGIATYGSGPPNVRVPQVLDAELRPAWSVDETVNFLKLRFTAAGADMGALVGGWDAQGNAILLDVRMDGYVQRMLPQLGHALPPLARRGVVYDAVAQQPPGTAASILAQMLELLTAACAGCPQDAGPPFEFLVIPR